MRNRNMLVLAVLLAFSTAIQANPFRKTNKPDPATQVPLLLQVLRSDADERTRVTAANMLREYDAKAFPEILPALTEALLTDKSTSVRSEAAESIGKIRPISIQAGYALEQAISNDKALSVRISAQAAMIQYRLLGFLKGKTDLAAQTAEPPLAVVGETREATPESVVLRPTPSPIPVHGPVAAPAPIPGVTSTALPGNPTLVPEPSRQSDEPPLATSPPKTGSVLTAQPRSGIPVITIPNSTPETTLPRPLPGSVKDRPIPPPPAEGPSLPPPPKS